MNFESNLIKGLHTGLRSWAESPRAFAVARNGGAESALRAHLLYDLEEATGCFAFTEADRKRIDVTLRSKNAPTAEAVLLELKHNLLHPTQQRYIENSRRRAIEQLTTATIEQSEITGRYYLHTVVELCDETPPQKKGLPTKNSLLVPAHNTLVTHYKRFLPSDKLQKEFGITRGVLGTPFARYPISGIPTGVKAKATLNCWLFAVSKSGTPTPIAGPSRPAAMPRDP